VGLSLPRLLLGRLLANREQDGRKIGAFEGVPAMGLDGLGSSAYGPEAALTVLVPLGAAGLAHVGTVMLPILALLAVLYVSYRQTVRAYPSNGGAYTVARENLGTNASLLAAAALMIDYVLNVAVGISAGVGALVSAVPVLHPYILPLCLAILGSSALPVQAGGGSSRRSVSRGVRRRGHAGAATRSRPGRTSGA
jgi:amino acid transporter